MLKLRFRLVDRADSQGKQWQARIKDGDGVTIFIPDRDSPNQPEESQTFWCCIPAEDVFSAPGVPFRIVAVTLEEPAPAETIELRFRLNELHGHKRWESRREDESGVTIYVPIPANALPQNLENAWRCEMLGEVCTSDDDKFRVVKVRLTKEIISARALRRRENALAKAQAEAEKAKAEAEAVPA